ncbi:MAG: hypothetical protein QOJ89_2272, partial [bacterium]
MTTLDKAHAQSLAGLSRHAVTLSTPSIPGLKVIIPRGSKVMSATGKPLKQLSVVPVPVDRPPFALPLGSYFPVYLSVQQAGATISRGARIIYPNYSHLPAGQRVPFWNYDPDKRGWYVYGQGTVSKDTRSIVPDAGVRVWRLSGAMISGSQLLAWLKNFLKGLAGADPVNYGSGLFTYEKTDLTAPGVLPAALTRTYRPADGNSYDFGIGTTSPYNMRLFSQNNYFSAELVLPDASTVRYTCVAGCSGNFNPAQLRYVAQNTSSEFYGSVLTHRGGGSDGSPAMWYLRLRNGVTYGFGELQQWGLAFIRDRFGDEVTVTRDSSGNLTQVTSSSGRWMTFQTDASHRITQASDNSGRVVRYDYNGQTTASACANAASSGPDGTLRCAKGAAGGETYYTYDAATTWMTQVKDARGNIM